MSTQNNVLSIGRPEFRTISQKYKWKEPREEQRNHYNYFVKVKSPGLGKFIGFPWPNLKQAPISGNFLYQWISNLD